MTDVRAVRWGRLSPRLHEVREGDRVVPATEALGSPPGVYGERLIPARPGVWRRWDPYRSKLSAALLKGFVGPLPRTGDRWLYLGAATGTTASHVADLVGRAGAVYAVEKSLRPFAQLLHLAERYPNLFPILADAAQPDEYLGWVPLVEGVYSDIAQPDQVEITRRNAELFLRERGPVLLVLKLASLARDRPPENLVARALEALRPYRPVGPVVALEPFHRQHRFLAASTTAGSGRPGSPRAVRRLTPGRVARVP